MPTFAEIDIEKELIINVGEEVTETLLGGSGCRITNNYEEIVICTYENTHQFLFKGLKRGYAEIKIHVPGYNYNYAVKVVDVISITLPSVLNLHIGEEYHLSPIVSDNEATTSLTWSSTDSSVVSISEDGIITALQEGSSSVICTAHNGVSAQCLVTVNPAMVSSITLNETEVEMTVGSRLQLEATVLPENATDKSLTWSSSNEDVAWVSGSGKVVAVGTGFCQIKATANDGSGKFATCFVDVTEASTIRGDIDGDGKVTITDVIKLIDLLLEKE